jgi:hypothetical protein
MKLIVLLLLVFQQLAYATVSLADISDTDITPLLKGNWEARLSDDQKADKVQLIKLLTPAVSYHMKHLSKLSSHHRLNRFQGKHF